MTTVRNGEVHVALTKSELKQLPLLPSPQAVVNDATVRDAVTAFEIATSRFPQKG